MFLALVASIGEVKRSLWFGGCAGIRSSSITAAHEINGSKNQDPERRDCRNRADNGGGAELRLSCMGDMCRLRSIEVSNSTSIIER